MLEKAAPAVAAADLIAGALPTLLRRFPWPKSMRWGGTSEFTWVRPLRRIVCLLDGAVVPFDLRDGADDGHGLASSNLTEGHRFHAPGAFAVASRDDWAAKLREHRVLVDADERKRVISEGIAALAAERQIAAGGRPRTAGRGGRPGRMAGAAARPDRRRPTWTCRRRSCRSPCASTSATSRSAIRTAPPRRVSASSPTSSRRTAAPRRSPATSACCAPASPMRGISGTSTARRGWKRACRSSTTSPSTRNSAPRASGCAGWRAWPRRSRHWSAPAPALAARRRAAGQGRPGHRHGRRVPRTARASWADTTRCTMARTPGRGRHPRPLRAAGPGRSGPRRGGVDRRGAGRQAGPTGWLLRHRRAADRGWRPLRAAPRRSGRHPHHPRKRAAADADAVASPTRRCGSGDCGRRGDRLPGTHAEAGARTDAGSRPPGIDRSLL